MKTVLVLGGYGFIGRHIVRQLRVHGVNVLIGTRAKGRALNVGDRRVLMHKMLSELHWREALAGVDTVVNSVGILRARRGESFEQVHHQAVAALSHACRKRNIRLVHISALGLNNPLNSDFARSKRDGEQAILRSKADWHILRASLVEGESGYGARWFRYMASWPVHCAPDDATGLICPVHVETLAGEAASVAVAERRDATDKERIVELGGEKLFSVFEYLQHLRGKPPLLTIRMPSLVCRVIAHLLDLLHLTPYSYGHYEILKYDNFPATMLDAKASKREIGQRQSELHAAS